MSTDRSHQLAEHALRIDLLVERVNSQTAVARQFERAWQFAWNAYHGQQRIDGRPYISHPVEVALLLKSRGCDTGTVVAGLLKDVLEDTDISMADLRQEFGADIAELVWRVTMPSRTDEIFTDPRTADILLCGRLSHLRLLHHESAAKRERVCAETLDVYTPMARRLGRTQVADELELLAALQGNPEYREEKDRFIALTGITPEMSSATYEHFGEVLSLLTICQPYLEAPSAEGAFPEMRMLAQRFEDLRASLLAAKAPSFEDLLGHVGPLDLKGVWTWGRFLFRYSKRASEVRGVLDRGDKLDWDALDERARHLPNVLDAVLAYGVVTKTRESLQKTADAVMHLLKRK